MNDALLCHLKRSCQVEDGAPMLDRGNAARGETLPVAQSIDELNDRSSHVARKDEVTVNRVRLARVVDCSSRGDERLCQNLTPEDATRSDVAVTPSVDVHF
jgi:hypothetical protein